MRRVLRGATVLNMASRPPKSAHIDRETCRSSVDDAGRHCHPCQEEVSRTSSFGETDGAGNQENVARHIPRNETMTSEVARLLAQLGTRGAVLSSKKRTLSFRNLASAGDDVAYMPLAGEQAVAAPWDLPCGGTDDVVMRATPFVAPAEVMRARVRHVEGGTMFDPAGLAPDKYVVRGDAFRPRLPAGAPYLRFEGGSLDRGHVLARGSHAFLRLRGESHLRVAAAPRAFGGCGSDYACLALSPTPASVLLRGELETGGDGELLRWISRGGTLRLRRGSDLDLPPSLAWEYVDGVAFAYDADADHRSKIQRLAGAGFAVKSDDPSPACVTRTIDF